MVFLATVALTDLSVHHHPERLLPGAGHRRDLRRHRRRAGHLVQRDGGDRSRSLNAIVAADPDTAAMAASIGAGVGRADRATTGGCIIALKPWDERVGGPRSNTSPGCARNSPRWRAAEPSCRRRRIFASAARLTKTEFQYTLQDADFDELFSWSPKVLAQASDAADAARRHQRSADRRHHGDPDHRPRQGGPIRRAAAGDRRHASTMRSARVRSRSISAR